MWNKKGEGFTPKVRIYNYGDQYKILYNKGLDLSKYNTKKLYIKIAEVLIKTKLPVECTFRVGFYAQDDFIVGIEKIGDFQLEENMIETFALNSNLEAIDIQSELFYFFVKRADDYFLRTQALQKEMTKLNKEFVQSFRTMRKFL